ncbi:MAG TPA: NAD+ synthase [Rhabdochlamydiaceae bacterium]|nr:NAD+ synthase [Rhabdochlamydiaceae bacterium]
MRLAVAQINPIVGDLEGNTHKILQFIKDARSQNADIVIFPELAICGYPPEDLLLHDDFIDKMEACLKRIVKASSDLMVIIGFVRRNPSSWEKPLYNSVAIIQDGKILGHYDKMLLPTYDVFDERRYFEAGSGVKTWEWDGKKIGVIICEDIWQHSGLTDTSRYPRDPILELLPHRPDLLINISGSPYHFQKPDVRVRVCGKASQTLNCPVVLCCQVGGNDELVFDGYSICVDEKGNLRDVAKGFEEDLMIVDLDAPARTPSFHYDAQADLYQALVLGVRDYFHKQGFKKGCLGLSGGIDSALVACIAADALGKENVLAVGMPSRFSSEGSVRDSETLAKNLGIRFEVIAIEGAFKEYLKLLDPYFQGRPFDVTEENLQARIRGMILMALSNKLGYIVMSTGNKSEMGMGYCTLYGDMAGGLGVIADVLKTQVYELSRWINREKEIIPQSIIDKAPSAELRANQKDSDSLPEYNVLDAIIKAYVEEFLSAEEISKRNNLPVELVTDIIKKIQRAEYKRRQAPPGIRVSKKSFRAGWRFPIVQKWLK